MITDLKSYPAMKPSGVPWLGDVPAGWDVLPGRACYREKCTPNTGMLEKTVLSLSYGRIVVKPPEKLHGLVPASFETYQIVEPGDIVCRPTDLQNDWNSLRFGFASTRGTITSAYMNLSTKRGIVPQYGYSLLHTYDLLKVFYGLGSGLRQNLDWSDFKYLPCLVPSPPEQSAIVRFHDYFDRRIRKYIRAKQKLIGLLNEQKQAIILKAVTRGLDPNVKLKPSGVPWLGDVPEHWEVYPAKYLYREVDERSSTGAEELLSVSHITGVTSRSQKNITMFMASSYVGHKLCRPEDLVINTMWAWMGALGVANQTGIVSPSYGVYRPLSPARLLGEYADLLFRTRSYRSEFLCRSTGIRPSRLRLYPEQFLRMRVAFPQRHEQSAILEHIGSETTGVDRAVDAAQREIALLREYRTRLVADVVTGKLDVREVATGLPEEAGEAESVDAIEPDVDDIEDSVGETEADDGEAGL